MHKKYREKYWGSYPKAKKFQQRSLNCWIIADKDEQRAAKQRFKEIEPVEAILKGARGE